MFGLSLGVLPRLLRRRALLDAAISSSSRFCSASSSASTCRCIALILLVHSARPVSVLGMSNVLLAGVRGEVISAPMLGNAEWRGYSGL